MREESYLETRKFPPIKQVIKLPNEPKMAGKLLVSAAGNLTVGKAMNFADSLKEYISQSRRETNCFRRRELSWDQGKEHSGFKAGNFIG